MAFQPLEQRKLLFGDPVFDLGTLDGENGFHIPGIDVDGQLGFSVTGIGDMNGDGIDDFAVSAPVAGQSLQEGRVYVVFGSTDLGSGGQFDLTALDGTNGFVIEGIDVVGRTGWSMSWVGDVNIDSYNDLVIGTPFGNAAYVIFGDPSVGEGGVLSLASLDGSNGFRIDGAVNDAIGFSVAGAGDVNSDGVNDILLGSPIGGEDSGIAYVVFGAAGIGANGRLSVTSLNGANGLFIPGIVADDEFAWRVAHAGDLNNDGIDDLAIGSLETSMNSAGAVYIIFGAPDIGSVTEGFIDVTTLDGSDGFVIRGLGDSHFFSTSISGGDDINGDGIHDLIVGSLIQNTYVIFGRSGIGAGGQFDLASLDGSNGYVAFLPTGAAAFVTHAGDLNDDGIGDVAIGAAGANEVYVYVGGPDVGANGLFDVSTVDGENGFVIQGVQLASGFVGEPIARGKDLNNDGRADLLIGAALANQGVGEAFVIFGVTITGLLAPANLTATALDEMSIELRWDDTTLFEDGFEVERSLDGITGWALIAQSPPSSGNSGSVSYPDGSLDPNTEYFYRVRAFNGRAYSAYSNIASAITLDAVPDAPTNLQAAPLSDTEIRLTWNDNSTNETGFNIYRLEGEFMTLAGSVGAGVTTFDDSGLQPATLYYYVVRALNDAGESDDSNIAFATTDGGLISAPAAPSDLSAVAISQSEIRLNWTDNSNNEEGFIIERATDPNLIWFEIDTVLPDQTQYVNMSLPSDSTYFYRVRAFNSAGSSTPSNVAGATTSPAQGGERRTEVVDADGDVAIFTLVGVGGSITYTTFGDGGIDTLYVAPSQSGVGSLNVSIVQAAGGDGRIQIGRLQGDISLGDLYVRVATINFGAVDLAGQGAWLCNVNRATFGDLTGSASIQGQVADLTLRDVNTTGSISLCDVFSFKARSLILGGGFEAYSIANLAVDGDADFSLTTTSDTGLGSMLIGGNAALRIDVQRAGQITISGDAHFTGSSQVADRLTRLKIGGSWLSGSLTVGQLVTKVEVAGDTAASATLNASGGCVVICGDSSATFNLDRFVRFTIKGDLLGGSINITDASDATVCISGDFVDGEIVTDGAGLWLLKVSGSVNTPASFDAGGLLHKAAIGGSLDGSISVGSADCIVVCGGFAGKFTAESSEGQVVGKFNVKGAANGGRFSSVGDVNCIALGEMDQAEIYIGLATNWSGGLPTDLGDFVQQSILNKLQVRGVTSGATIASASIANLCLREISDQQTFNLGAAQVGRAKLTVENQSYSLGPDEIFTGLPALPYLNIVQLLESGGI